MLHKSIDDIWVIFDGNVYNLTKYAKINMEECNEYCEMVGKNAIPIFCIYINEISTIVKMKTHKNTSTMI